MSETIKEVAGWLGVVVLFTFIILIVITGGGILSPDYWRLLLNS